ncbi:MAG: hypothetical protein HDR13_02810 [Lachnospiraceae bacterium]|nr:hypothetical protein [Lachnospiraceae bacterium]
MKEVNVQRNQKDTIFRMLFREKENLLSLYNAVNKTAYADEGELEITTLENAVYMNYKNDVSFVFDFQLMLYEHQSTVNPNMPLRDLLYVTDVLQGRIRNEDLYNRSLVKIPAPKFIVFYNGVDFQPERQTLRLSKAFEKKLEHPELELTVSVYNINLGHNTELLETCHVLKEYAQYVAQVRAFAKNMPFAEGVKEAVDYCIREGILRDFLSKNRAEAVAVSIYEYDEEKHMKAVREEEREEGREEGEEKMSKLVQKLIGDRKDEDLQRALSDREYRKKLYCEYGIE